MWWCDVGEVGCVKDVIVNLENMDTIVCWYILN